MGEKDRRVDAIRYGSSEMENHLIDTYSAGRLSRREFVRRGTVDQGRETASADRTYFFELK